MKVISLDSSSGFGEVKDLRPGYARYLIRQKFAMPYSLLNAAIFQERRSQIQNDEKNVRDMALKNKERLEGMSLVIPQNSTEDGRLYGTLQPAVIAKFINQIAEEGILKKSFVAVSSPITRIGTYKVKISLYQDIKFDLEINVVRS